MSTPPGLFPCGMASKGMSPSKTTVLRTRNKEEKRPLEGSLLGIVVVVLCWSWDGMWEGTRHRRDCSCGLVLSM